MEMTASHDENIRKIGRMIKDIQIAMLTTADEGGNLYSRPMVCQQAEFNGDLWFFTSKSSGKTRNIMNNQHVNLSYASPSEQKYISISGTAEIVQDRKKQEELWTPSVNAWFPKGVDDPNLVLLRIKAESAEFWDSPSSAMVQVIEIAKAAVTGQPYKPDDSQNQRVDFH